MDAIAAAALDRPAPLTLVNTFHMGGAIDDVGAEDTAFAERGRASSWSRSTACGPTAEDDAERIAWVRRAWDDIGRYGNGSVYLNFTGLRRGAAERGRGQRLRAEPRAPRRGEGRTYDPENFFRLNNNIAPSG